MAVIRDTEGVGVVLLRSFEVFRLWGMGLGFGGGVYALNHKPYWWS